jgi:hypothetical protein
MGKLVPYWPLGVVGKGSLSRNSDLKSYYDSRKPVSLQSYKRVSSDEHPFSSWRRIKNDFLHHFHKTRLDLLVWILTVQLAPAYYRKLDQLLEDNGRSQELASWRKAFKREWTKLANTPTTVPTAPSATY